jgi:3-oxoacyl-[acyl-carrier-protein] synthase-3
MPSIERTYLRGVGAFLPNAPVGNDRIEEVLGKVGGRPSRARHRILKNNGIRERHYAIDPETGRQTHSNTNMTVESIRAMARSCGLDLDTIDCLVCGTSSPDQLMPNHALMVHGELGIPTCEVVATAGTCLSGLTALKYAVMSVACGQSHLAVATGSELASSVVRASSFPEQETSEAELERAPVLAFGQDFLRWMLSDGAGAVLVGNRPNPTGLSLEVEWIDVVSFAHELEPCMYWGCEKTAEGELIGWREAAGVHDAVQRGMLNLTQDARLLGREVGQRSVNDGFSVVRERHPLEAEQIDWFLPHYSSEFFRQEVYDRLVELDFEIPYERWFTNLATKGNTGSASIFIMLDDLMRSGRVKPGQKLLCMVPESARFSVGYALLTAVGPEG